MKKGHWFVVFIIIMFFLYDLDKSMSRSDDDISIVEAILLYGAVISLILFLGTQSDSSKKKEEEKRQKQITEESKRIEFEKELERRENYYYDELNKENQKRE